jgi:hypothetical protein
MRLMKFFRVPLSFEDISYTSSFRVDALASYQDAHCTSADSYLTDSYLTDGLGGVAAELITRPLTSNTILSNHPPTT